ncbi:MAG: asparagine synthetase B, partial [Phycisphaerales bacterium]|nr:asparagine synthetase B [Phycisphaerales bacterium]
MCGIAGFFDPSGRLADPAAVLESMQSQMVRRGPDDRGIFFDSERRVGLAHRRLSIVDLSPQGRQPMVSASGRYRIDYNGEVYNFQALRQELEAEGGRVVGGSDTAVVLAAFERWGVEEALDRFVGMFAFAVLDIETNRLVLARDRLGIKPLYHGWIGPAKRGVFAFGSDLRALAVVPGFEGTIDRGAVAAYLRFLYVPCPWTIFAGIGKLAPGHLAIVHLDDGAVEQRRWWDARSVAAAAAAQPIDDEREAVDRLEAALGDAVQLRMVSDVPLGAFLSGG